MRLRSPLRIDPRQRAGIVIVAAVYAVGYIVGRAGGRVDCARAMLESYAAGTRGA